jgi:alpha/beta superfamily hydrolase
MKYLTTLFIQFVILFAGTIEPATAQSLSGHWEGHIAIQGNELIIKTDFTQSGDPDASYSGTIDIPQQGASGLPLQKIRPAENDSVFAEFIAGPGNPAQFKGAFQGDSVISGNLYQGGMQSPFELRRTEPGTESKKQEAKAPKPYHHEDLIIQNDSVDIGGTLTWPKDEQANQLVIMMSGSGAQDRDESMQPVSSFKPFAVLADSLTAAGVATFRYDDRGVGESTGNFGDATLEILASDVNAIIKELKNRQDHTFEKIILLGHSQGGLVGGNVAAENSAADKLILMASPGVSLKEVLRFQLRQAFAPANLDGTLIKNEISARENLMKAIVAGKGIDQAQEEYQRQFEKVQLAAGKELNF